MVFIQRVERAPMAVFIGADSLLPTDNFVKLARPKRDIKAKHVKDHITSNIVEKRTCNKTTGLE
jgi:hypothetical protein